MVRRIGKDERQLEELDPAQVAGAKVRAADPIIGRDGNLSAGFTEYRSPCRLEWTFDYDEVFFMIEGSLQIQRPGESPVLFAPGDLGFIERGDRVTIVVEKHAYFLHVTQPSWRSWH